MERKLDIGSPKILKDGASFRQVFVTVRLHFISHCARWSLLYLRRTEKHFLEIPFMTAKMQMLKTQMHINLRYSCQIAYLLSNIGAYLISVYSFGFNFYRKINNIHEHIHNCTWIRGRFSKKGWSVPQSTAMPDLVRLRFQFWKTKYQWVFLEVVRNLHRGELESNKKGLFGCHDC